MNNFRLHCAAAVIAVAVFSAVPVAHGQVLGADTVEGTYTQPVNSGWQAIPVGFSFTGPPTRTALPFKTTSSNVRVVITYNTSCLALGFAVYVRAKVDGVVASPGTVKDVRLCFTTVSGSSYPASRMFTAVVPAAGAHNVTIELMGDQNAAVSIGDSTVVVQQ